MQVCGKKEKESLPAGETEKSLIKVIWFLCSAFSQSFWFQTVLICAQTTNHQEWEHTKDNLYSSYLLVFPSYKQR